MLAALIVMLMNAAGVAPTPQQMQNYELQYRERMHHVRIDRQFNGVSFEVLGQKLGRLLFKGPQQR